MTFGLVYYIIDLLCICPRPCTIYFLLHGMA